MTFKPALWRPIAFGLSALNLVAVGFAAGDAEPWHAAGHAALAMAFGYWAQRLRRAPGGADREERLEMLEDEVSQMRRELVEAQERIDFAERLLAQGREQRKIEQER
ncbi:MAG TPA: hypothetical protein VD930_06935 [Gemmatimonadales bacterium]|nr:hypothetical protein [Gemmatimonadales bacterium]